MVKIKVCMWNSCKGKFWKYMTDRINNDINHFNLENIEIEETLCMWECKKAPNAKVDWEIINYSNWNKLSALMFKKIKK